MSKGEFNLKRLSPKVLLLGLLLLLPLGSSASVDLISWQPSPQLPKIILPKRSSETPTEAVARYITQTQTNADLQSLFRGSSIENYDVRNVKSLDLQTAKPGTNLGTTKVRAAVIANQPSDLTGGARVMNVLETLRKAGGDPVVVALAADYGLNEDDAKQFQNLISNKFDILVGLGGDDVDPGLYGEENRYAVNTNLTRDKSEIALITTFKKIARGVYFGICRGHQIAAVADGHSLFQDIEKDGIGVGSEHRGPEGSDSNFTYHHIQVSDSLILRFLNYQRNPMVNSMHHQAVRLSSLGKSQPVAYHDQVVEALEGNNKMSFSVQFHPEVVGDDTSNLGFYLIRNILAYSRLKRAELMSPSAPRCRQIFHI